MSFQRIADAWAEHDSARQAKYSLDYSEVVKPEALRPVDDPRDQVFTGLRAWLP